MPKYRIQPSISFSPSGAYSAAMNAVDKALISWIYVPLETSPPVRMWFRPVAIYAVTPHLYAFRAKFDG